MIYFNLSLGLDSIIACYLLQKEIEDFEILYIHIDDMPEDVWTVLEETEELLGRKITVLQSRYRNVDNVIRQFGFMKRPGAGAVCSNVLKRRVRKEFESTIKGDITYVWGFDAKEKHRAEAIKESVPYAEHIFPLIDKELTKKDVHGLAQILKDRGHKMSVLDHYREKKFNNYNCIGCIEGGIAYWLNVKENYPDVFERRSKLERELGFSILKDKDGPLFLDELEPGRGRASEVLDGTCDIFCSFAAEMYL